VTPRPMPRDPRGRLRMNGSRFEVLLPGMVCNGGNWQVLLVEKLVEGS
jgi:hypothetical protein